MWKQSGIELSVEELVDKFKIEIEGMEPAGDVRESYRDALDAGATELELDVILQWALENELLTQEEVDMIKEPPPGPEEWAHMS